MIHVRTEDRLHLCVELRSSWLENNARTENETVVNVKTEVISPKAQMKNELKRKQGLKFEFKQNFGNVCFTNIQKRQCL